ncbi:MAG: hypothetical protein HY304_06395, partial [candidate division Zixibacteria bacterium]|nr:hypothetical protein [candidate division Zixibacteria bacterium]
NTFGCLYFELYEADLAYPNFVPALQRWHDSLNTLARVGGVDPCPCACPCHADPRCDSVVSDVLDVTNTVNVAFRGSPAMIDPGCPRDRTDVDCTGATDVLDVTRVVDVAFRGADAAVKYCDPCAQILSAASH